MANTSGHESENAGQGPSARCSFCLADGDPGDVGDLIEGPARGELAPAYICENCVDLCASIFEDRKRRNSAPRDEAANERMAQGVDEALRTLTDTERQIFKLLLGLGDRLYTLNEVSRLFNVTPEDVREIQTRAISIYESRNLSPRDA
jgi:sigma-70-like protein/ClpX C4-type zinc finger protein